MTLLKSKKHIFFLLAILLSLQAAAQDLHTEGTRIVNGRGENVILRGIGLGGWMLQEGYMLKINKEGQQYRIRQRLEQLAGMKETQEFYDLWLKNHTRKIDIDSLKAWGFNSVRLPMHYNLYTLPVEKEPLAGKNTWLDKGFAMTDSLLAWCKANQIYLILDLHATPGGQGNDLNIADRDPSKPSLWDSEANQQKTIALWQKLAERYVNEPWIGGYDIINEPNQGFENPATDSHGTKEQKNIPLQKLMIEITKAIRSVDKKHMIIIEGNGWGNNYNGITPDWDQNMVLSFHKYWNYNDQASIAHILKMREQYHMPAWLGETGENSNVWFTDAIRLLEKNNIGWSWWPLKKIGFNNPSEIKNNADYNSTVDYINGKTHALEKGVAFKGLMALAEAVKLENTIIHKDVIDAMIRQPFTDETLPFKNNTVASRKMIYAVDYDLGKNGFAYFDHDTADYHVSTGKTTPGNKGRIYRNDGVDISRDTTRADAWYVDSMESGEWLQYTLNVQQAGNYTVNLMAAAVADGAKVSVSAGHNNPSTEVMIPSTGSTVNFRKVTIKNIKLDQGKQVLRVQASTGGFTLSSLELIKKLI